MANVVAWARVEPVIAGDLGVEGARRFAEIEREPFAADLVTQQHRAVLTDGRPVAVTILRPDARSGPDLVGEALNLQRLHDLTASSQTLRIAGPQLGLCGPHMLTTAWVAGTTVATLRDATPADRNDDYDNGANRAGNAQTLLAAVLELTWHVRFAVLDFAPVNLILTEDGRLAFRGTVPCVGIPTESAAALRRSLQAAVADAPARAAMAVAALFVETDRSDRQRFYGEVVTQLRARHDQRPGGSSDAEPGPVAAWIADVLATARRTEMEEIPAIAGALRTLLAADSTARALWPTANLEQAVALDRRWYGGTAPELDGARLASMAVSAADLLRDAPDDLRSIQRQRTEGRFAPRVDVADRPGAAGAVRGWLPVALVAAIALAVLAARARMPVIAGVRLNLLAAVAASVVLGGAVLGAVALASVVSARLAGWRRQRERHRDRHPNRRTDRVR